MCVHFFACMQRGCDKIPNMRSQEKKEVELRIQRSMDTNVRYDFWSALEPGRLCGIWEGPPDFPYSGEDSDCTSPSSKRKPEEDGTGTISKLHRPDTAETEHGSS